MEHNEARRLLLSHRQTRRTLGDRGVDELILGQADTFLERHAAALPLVEHVRRRVAEAGYLQRAALPVQRELLQPHRADGLEIEDYL